MNFTGISVVKPMHIISEMPLVRQTRPALLELFCDCNCKDFMRVKKIQIRVAVAVFAKFSLAISIMFNWSSLRRVAGVAGA